MVDGNLRGYAVSTILECCVDISVYVIAAMATAPIKNDGLVS